MKVLITGAHGQVGSELVNTSTQRGFEVIATGSKELDITQIEKNQRSCLSTST